MPDSILPDNVKATARFAVVVGGDVFDLASVELSALTDYYGSHGPSIGITDSAANPLGVVQAGSFVPAWRIHVSRSCDFRERATDAAVAHSARTTFDAVAEASA